MAGISGILNFLALVFWAVAVSGIVLAVSATSRRASARPGVTLLILGVVGGVITSVLSAGLIVVAPQEVGVVFRSIGGDEDSIVDTPLGPGVNWVIPFIDQVSIYPTERQSVTMAPGAEGGGRPPIQARTNDGQEVTIDVTVIFRVTPATANQVYKDWRIGYVEGAVEPFVREEVRNAISELSVEQVYGQRTAIGPAIFEMLAPRLQIEGINLVELAIRDISFSPEFVDAVERKQIAEQEVERATNEAEAVRRAALGERDAAITRAEGQAEAVLLRAQAEAEALRLINAQISQNPNLIQWRYIEQLGDNIQLIVIPSNSPFLFDLESLLREAGVGAPVPASPAETE
jgi:regulator of protease activity HflC (stomatin/prohibitin superfamily)